MEVAQESLNEVNNDAELLKRVITGDETWVYGYDVENKAQSSQWRHSGSPRSKKGRQVRSNLKVTMTTLKNRICEFFFHLVGTTCAALRSHVNNIIRNVRSYQRTKMAVFNENIPQRAVLGVMMFLACMFTYIIRTNLFITMEAMVNTTKKDGGVGPSCSVENTKSNKSVVLKDYGERFEWDQSIQDLLLSGYFYGILPACIPAGLLAERYGGAKVVAVATLIPAGLNLLMPWAASVHYGFVLVLRIVMGAFGGALYPALHAMIARWVPPGEKGIFVWILQDGQFELLASFALCRAVISAHGWKATFYVISIPMLVFSALWAYLIYDTPDLHPYITDKEKKHIKERIGTIVSNQKIYLPVKSVVTSLPFLVLLWAHIAQMWGIYFIATYGPKYTLEVLGSSMKTVQDAATTGLPYIAKPGAGVLFAAAGDYVRRKNFVSLTRLRKIFMPFSHLGPAGCLIVMTYVGCDSTIVIIMIMLALACYETTCQTCVQNHQDMAPNYAGSLYGIMYTFGTFPRFIIPPIIGALTSERNGVEEWRAMFWISAGMYISGTVLFWLFGSGEIQSWNDSTRSEVPILSNEENQIDETTKDGVDRETEENERL